LRVVFLIRYFQGSKNEEYSAEIMKFSSIRQILTAVATGLLLVHSASGHGTDLPRPSKAEFAKIQPAIRGSAEFARALFTHFGLGLDAKHSDAVARVGQMLFYQGQIAGGFSPHSGPQDTEYFR